MDPEEFKEDRRKEITKVIEEMRENPLTAEELREQTKLLRQQGLINFALDAPRIQVQVRALKFPLHRSDFNLLVRALNRGQITLRMIPEDVLEEFKKTRYFENIQNFNNLL